MIQENNPSKIVEHIIQILEKDSEYFKGEIIKFKDILDKWNKNVIRVGLIGVTSSGKSTLINALIGEELLPMKVRPSSNCLVSCRWAEDKSATVFFQDDSKKILNGSEIKSELSRYADESENPNNKYKVKEIHLFHPNFKLGKKVELIDSPGLDAYGYDIHEKLTLVTMLPTLDFVIYLTTTKAQSDRQNLDFIVKIIQNKKSFLIVQNMIDSVEPKIIKGGIIAKTREEVLKEHADRIRHLLQHTNNEQAKKAEIIQISAIWALNGNFKESGIGSLVDYFEKITDRNHSLFDKERKERIHTYLDEIVVEKNTILDNQFNKINTLDKEEKRIKEYIKQMDDELALMMKNTEQVVSRIEAEFNSMISFIRNHKEQISKLDEHDKDIAKVIINKIQSVINNGLSSLISIILDIQSFNENKASKFNIYKDDYRDALITSQSKPDVILSAYEKTETRTELILVDRPTIGGKIKRFFGFLFDEPTWGRDWVEKPYTVRIFDKKKTLQQMDKQIQNLSLWKDDIVKKVKAQSLTIHRICEDEAKKKIDYLREQKKLNINATPNELIKRKEIINKLKALSDDLKKQLNLTNDGGRLQDRKLKDEESYKMIEIDEVLLNLYKLSDSIVGFYFESIRDYCLESDGGYYESIAIIGWDSGAIDEFFRLFWRDIEIDLSMENGYKFIKTNKYKFKIVNENKLKMPLSESELASVIESDVFFIVADILQIGNTESNISRSPILRHESFRQKKRKRNVFVIQDIQSLINSNSLSEAIKEMSEMLNRTQLPIYAYLANNSSPIYSIVITEKLTKLNNKKTVTSEIETIQDFKRSFGLLMTDEITNNIAKILRA